jgi:hypothetical protein
MADYFGAAGNYFDKAFAAQTQAAAMQKARTSGLSDDAEINPYSTSLTIGAIPPNVNQAGTEQGEINDYVSDVKEDLLSQAKEKRRPVNGGLTERASGGINTAVMR